MILALDPSSTRCGYALMQSHSILAEAGILTPGKTKDPAYIRIPAMARDLAELIDDAKPTEIIIEITSGHVNHARNKGSGAGLGIYGMAVGYLWRVCEEKRPESVVKVEENVWTKGIRKEKRTATIAALFRQYRPENDRGGDVADAIGLGRWWFMGLGREVVVR